MIEDEHEFVTQHLLSETIKDKNNFNRYDVIIMNTPTFSLFDNNPNNKNNNFNNINNNNHDG